MKGRRKKNEQASGSDSKVSGPWSGGEKARQLFCVCKFSGASVSTFWLIFRIHYLIKLLHTILTYIYRLTFPPAIYCLSPPCLPNIHTVIQFLGQKKKLMMGTLRKCNPTSFVSKCERISPERVLADVHRYRKLSGWRLSSILKRRWENRWRQLHWRVVDAFVAAAEDCRRIRNDINPTSKRPSLKSRGCNGCRSGRLSSDSRRYKPYLQKSLTGV